MASEDLLQYVDLKQSQVLNNDSTTGLSSILAGDGVLKSDEDVDEQLLLTLTFNQLVKIRSFGFRADATVEGASGPKNIKVFLNQPNLGFSDCEDAKATQSFNLKLGDLAGTEHPTKYAKWQSVRCITIFIADNQNDDEVTFLNGLSISGSTIDGFNMNDLKKSG